MDIYKEMNAIWNYVTALDNYLLPNLKAGEKVGRKKDETQLSAS